MLDGSGVSLIQDPSPDFPYHEIPESYLDTAIRLLPYLSTRRSTSHSPERYALTPSRRSGLPQFRRLDRQVPGLCPGRFVSRRYRVLLRTPGSLAGRP
jgi:hypothetical protein